MPRRNWLTEIDEMTHGTWWITLVQVYLILWAVKIVWGAVYRF